jgi:hypothetical protein
VELVAKLADWGTSDEFRDALDQWMDARVLMNNDGSEPVNWAATFEEYNQWLDGQLDKFCESVGAGYEEVSKAVASTLEVVLSARLDRSIPNLYRFRWLQSGRETEGFPEFMRYTEYDAFTARMRKRAVENTQPGAKTDTLSAKSCDVFGQKVNGCTGYITTTATSELPEQVDAWKMYNLGTTATVPKQFPADTSTRHPDG